MIFKLFLVFCFLQLPLNLTASDSLENSQIELQRFSETCFAIKELLDWWLPINKNEILKLINGKTSTRNKKIIDDKIEIFKTEFKQLEENFDYCFFAETEFPETEKLEEIYREFAKSSEEMRPILIQNGFKAVDVDTRINTIKTNYDNFINSGLSD